MYTNYDDVVSVLITCGDLRNTARNDWPDYQQDYGISAKHIPQLVQMIHDDAFNTASSDSAEMWAPIHAWRALGQLQATEAIDSLIKLLIETNEDDDWGHEEIPKVLGMMGPAMIEPVTKAMFEQRHSVWVPIGLARSFVELAEHYPGTREQCVAALANQLKMASGQDHDFNSFLINYLVNLKAIEHLDLIREAFSLKVVSYLTMGDLEDVEIALGVRTQRSTPRPHYMKEYMQRKYGLDNDWLNKFFSKSTQSLKIGRNEPCPCDSGKKYKKCCLNKLESNNLKTSG